MSFYVNLDAQVELEISEWNLNSHSYSDPSVLGVAFHHIEKVISIAAILAIALEIRTANRNNTVTAGILGMDRFMIQRRLDCCFAN